MEKKTDVVSTHISLELRQRFDDCAMEIEGISRSELMARLIQEYLDRQERKFSVLARVFKG